MNAPGDSDEVELGRVTLAEVGSSALLQHGSPCSPLLWALALRAAGSQMAYLVSIRALHVPPPPLHASAAAHMQVQRPTAAPEVLDPTMPHTAAPASTAAAPQPTLEDTQEYSLELTGVHIYKQAVAAVASRAPPCTDLASKYKQPATLGICSALTQTATQQAALAYAKR